MFDYSEKINFEPVDTGDYEVVIETAEYKQSTTGKNYISLKFLIRKDVNQNFQGRYIFDRIWENNVYKRNDGKRISKDDYEKMSSDEKATIKITKEYNDYQIRTLIQAQDEDVKIKNAQGLEEDNPNYKTKFEDMDDVVLFLNGLALQIKVIKYNDDKTGEERNSVDYKGIKRTNHHLASANLKNNNFSASNEKVDIDDGDLPF